MVARRSAGIVLFRGAPDRVEVLIGHMGGPFWARKDAGGWSIPKGEIEDGEDPLDTARREFGEELGLPLPEGELIELGEAKQSSGKIVTAWALAGDLDPAQAVFGTFSMEWPRGSGRLREFPELDRAGWFDLPTAAEKLVTGQRPLLDRLAAHLS